MGENCIIAAGSAGEESQPALDSGSCPKADRSRRRYRLKPVKSLIFFYPVFCMHSIRRLLPHLSKDLSLEYKFFPDILDQISGGKWDTSRSVFSDIVLGSMDHPEVS